MRETYILQQQELIRPLPHFRSARESPSPGERLKRVRAAARRFREDMLAGKPVSYYRTCELVHVPYPTQYGLRDACTVPVPLIHILNRMFVVQFASADGLKTLLVSPSDIDANSETPFFKRLARSFGPFQKLAERFLAPRQGSVESWLVRLGIAPWQVDFLTYDHLHTQDLRKWLGTDARPALFPKARLLVMRQEWASAQALLPPQRDWYCPNGIEGISPDRILLLDEDVMLGEGVALLHTPGHTEGNHSIVVHTPGGLFVTSENGISADSYAPENSRIPSLRRYAHNTSMEAVLNGNTLERGLDQYISMIQEKEIAGRSRRNPDFCDVIPSSELRHYWLFPWIRPTFTFGTLEFGTLQKKGNKAVDE